MCTSFLRAVPQLTLHIPYRAIHKQTYRHISSLTLAVLAHGSVLLDSCHPVAANVPVVDSLLHIQSLNIAAFCTNSSQLCTIPHAKTEYIITESYPSTRAYIHKETYTMQWKSKMKSSHTRGGFQWTNIFHMVYRFLQIIMACVVIGYYASDLNAARKVHKYADSKWVGRPPHLSSRRRSC